MPVKGVNEQVVMLSSALDTKLGSTELASVRDSVEIINTKVSSVERKVSCLEQEFTKRHNEGAEFALKSQLEALEKAMGCAVKDADVSFQAQLEVLEKAMGGAVKDMCGHLRVALTKHRYELAHVKQQICKCTFQMNRMKGNFFSQNLERRSKKPRIVEEIDLD